MTVNETDIALQQTNPNLRKRKRKETIENLTIDPSLPQPISKKLQRKQKKLQDPQKGKRRENASQNHDIPQIDPNTNKDNTQQRSAYGVWIGNLPWTASKSTLREYVVDKTSLDENVITRMHMPTPKKKDASRAIKVHNKGFVYMDLKDESTLKSVLLLNESLLGGRKLLIKNAKDFEGRPEKVDAQHNEIRKEASANGTYSESKRIFVGNLGYDVTKDDLHNHFQVYGDISDLHVATFEDTGKCKGYAWITFSHQQTAEKAVKGYVDSSVATSVRERKRRQSANKMHGRPLRCEFAEDPSIRYKKRYGKK